MAFTVTRSHQSFVRPFEPGTPSGTLQLSLIDRVPGLRHKVNSLHVFRHGHAAAKVIGEALSKALVFYYPFAGRILGMPGQDDVRVECTGDGAWFVEAAAHCSLEDVNYLDHPLMISSADLLPNPCPENDSLDLPLMMQVTEFTCGGFVVGIVSVHTMADGLGAAQFMNAVADMARGLPRPTVEPVWCRDVIPKPPKLPPRPPPVFHSLKLEYSTMDIPLYHINHLKSKYFELTGQRCSTFDVSVAHAWRSRTRAIKSDPDDQVHLCFFASTRHLLHGDLPAGKGYYGNCFYPVTVSSPSGRIERAELVEVVKVIRDAKARLSTDFARWATGDFKADPYELAFTYNSLFVSDWTRLGFAEVDFGWGPPSHVIPFAYNDFMAVAILGSPPTPKKGTRLMTQCVAKEHLAEFHDQITNLR